MDGDVDVDVDVDEPVSATRAILKLTYRCNSRCLFCRVDDYRATVPDPPLDAIARKLAMARDLGCNTVIFSGGEPTLRRDLAAIARAAKALGLEFGLITNGRRLGQARYRETLLRLGLAYVHTSLHGATAATHDRIVQCDSFDQVLAALAGLASSGVELHVNTVVTATNARELSRISDLLAGFGALTHKLCLMEPKGLYHANEAEIAIPPDEAGRSAMAAVHRAQRLYWESGLETVVEGFPSCQIAFTREAVSGLRRHGILWMSEAFEDEFHPTDHGARVFPASCDGCPVRDGCPGVYEGYARPVETRPTVLESR